MFNFYLVYHFQHLLYCCISYIIFILLDIVLIFKIQFVICIVIVLILLMSFNISFTWFTGAYSATQSLSSVPYTWQQAKACYIILWRIIFSLLLLQDSCSSISSWMNRELWMKTLIGAWVKFILPWCKLILLVMSWHLISATFNIKMLKIWAPFPWRLKFINCVLFLCWFDFLKKE